MRKKMKDQKTQRKNPREVTKPHMWLKSKGNVEDCSVLELRRASGSPGNLGES